MQKYALFAVAILAVAATATAQEKADAEAKKRVPVNVGGVEVKAGGTVVGVVRFKGVKPEPKPLTDIAGNSFCKSCYKDGELPQRDNVVFGKNGSDETLQNVLVYVSKGLEGKKFDPPKQPVVLDQVGCVYTPHVVAVMTGQTLEIRNSDATLHNVMAAPRANPPFNFGMPVKDQKSEKVFKAAELKMNLKCFMHPWMSCYVHVLEHPFFAVTGPDGTFKIQGLPPGEYELTVLHETSLFEPTPAVAKVKVAAGETKTVDFTYQSKSGAR